jgi:hypothetical protein
MVTVITSKRDNVSFWESTGRLHHGANVGGLRMFSWCKKLNVTLSSLVAQINQAQGNPPPSAPWAQLHGFRETGEASIALNNAPMVPTWE